MLPPTHGHIISLSPADFPTRAVVANRCCGLDNGCGKPVQPLCPPRLRVLLHHVLSNLGAASIIYDPLPYSLFSVLSHRRSSSSTRTDSLSVVFHVNSIVLSLPLIPLPIVSSVWMPQFVCCTNFAITPHLAVSAELCIPSSLLHLNPISQPSVPYTPIHSCLLGNAWVPCWIS